MTCQVATLRHSLEAQYAHAKNINLLELANVPLAKPKNYAEVSDLNSPVEVGNVPPCFYRSHIKHKNDYDLSYAEA